MTEAASRHQEGWDLLCYRALRILNIPEWGKLFQGRVLHEAMKQAALDKSGKKSLKTGPTAQHHPSKRSS